MVRPRDTMELFAATFGENQLNAWMGVFDWLLELTLLIKSLESLHLIFISNFVHLCWYLCSFMHISTIMEDGRERDNPQTKLVNWPRYSWWILSLIISWYGKDFVFNPRCRESIHNQKCFHTIWSPIGQWSDSQIYDIVSGCASLATTYFKVRSH